MTDKELIQAARVCQRTRGCGGCTLFKKCPGRAAYLAMAADRLEALLAENERLLDSARRLWAGMPRYCGDLPRFAMHADEPPSTDGVERMSGKGCEYCPVTKPCLAFQYRGSGCAALRAEAGAFGDPDKDLPVTNGDHIRAMTDEELAGYMAKMLADYTTGLYDGSYVPSDKVVCEMASELLRQLQQPCESEGKA